MDHSEDPGTICAGTEEPVISNRSMHRRVKQREGRAKRRAARRETRGDAKYEIGSSVDAAVASNMADSSPSMRQSLVSNSKGVSTEGITCKSNDNDQISQKNQRRLEVPKGQTTMHHQGTGSTVASASRRRPRPAQRNIRFARELFTSDTRPSDWDLVCAHGQHAAFPHTDHPVPFGRISALAWEIEYMALDVIDRPLSGFKEIKRLYVEKTKDIAFYRKKLAKLKVMNDRLKKNYVKTGREDAESANDYRSLRYAKLLFTYLVPILEFQQTKLHGLMKAAGEAYSILKDRKQRCKQQNEFRQSVQQQKQRQLELRKQIQEERQGGQQRTYHWISEWKRLQNALNEKRKSLISDKDLMELSEQQSITRKVYEILLRDRTTKIHLFRSQAAYSFNSHFLHIQQNKLY